MLLLGDIHISDKYKCSLFINSLQTNMSSISITVDNRTKNNKYIYLYTIAMSMNMYIVSRVELSKYLKNFKASLLILVVIN